MNSIDATPDLGPWGDHTLEDGAASRFAFGPLTVHAARHGDELRVASEHTAEPRDAGEEDAPSGLEEPHGLEWSRWATAGWEGQLHFDPVFPDRPLVVGPEDPFHLLAGAEARIYVRVPLWVRIDVGSGRKRATVATLPSIPASDTWWGTVEEGELGYWLTTHARRGVTDDLFEPHLAMCPLQLVNRSGDDLTVDKVAIRVVYLSLYADGDHIWADETRVRYQGDDEGSRLEVAGKPPAEAPDARLLGEPGERMVRGFRARTFARLRSLPGWMG